MMDIYTFLNLCLKNSSVLSSFSFFYYKGMQHFYKQYDFHSVWHCIVLLKMQLM
jgi:hypothetical protein